MSPADILRVREVVKEIYMDERIKDYIVQLVFATRKPQDYKLDLKDLIQFGASPRATIYLAQAARAHAFIKGRGYVTPEDIKADRPGRAAGTGSSSPTRPRPRK